jgi:hypothetical protein
MTATIYKCGAYPCDKVIEANMKHIQARKNRADTRYENHKHSMRIEVDNLPPMRSIFYFAPNHPKRGQAKELLNHADAYKGLKNSGVADVSATGKATIHIRCPQVYINEDNKVYPRHFHFYYFHKDTLVRYGPIQTRHVMCKIDKAELGRKSNVVILDARSVKDHAKSTLFGKSTSVPSASSKHMVETTLSHVDKHTPIAIIGSDRQVKKLKATLDSLGYTNTWYY